MAKTPRANGSKRYSATEHPARKPDVPYHGLDADGDEVPTRNSK